MFIFSELLHSLALLLSLLFNIIYFVLVLRIVLSWVGADPSNEIVRVIYAVSEPLLAPFRRLPLQAGGMDFSPIIVFILLSVLKNFMVNIIYQIAYRLG
ncbi:MAG: YggT family protein [Candidatus Omnitrophota bacterium]